MFRLEELASLFRGDCVLLSIALRRCIGKGAHWDDGGAVERVKPLAPRLRHDELVCQPEHQRNEAPDNATHRRGHECAKHAPVVCVEALLDQDQVGTLQRAAVVDGAEDEDGQDAAQAAHHDLEAAPPVEAAPQAEAEHGDDGGGHEVADEVDLQDGRRLEGQHDDGEDDQDDEGAHDPDVEPVAEDVVGGRGHHGGLEAVEC